jgi:hypothetical protein
MIAIRVLYQNKETSFTLPMLASHKWVEEVLGEISKNLFCLCTILLSLQVL